MLGMGSGGGLPSDPYIFGLGRAAQTQRYEALDAVVRLLTETAPITLRAEAFELQGAVLQLRPYSYPHMPLALVTGTNRETLERVGRYGARWLAGVGPERFDESWAVIEAAAAEAGRQTYRYDAYVSVNVHLADTREQALENIHVGAARERYDFSAAVTSSPLPDVPRERGAKALAERPTDIIGTPGDAVAKLRPLLERTGAGGVLIWSKEWAPREATWRSYELFARYVMPEFQGSLVGLREAEKVARELVVST